MKRLTTKILTVVACAAMMLTAAPLANAQSVQAATTSQGTINLTTQKLVISKGSKTAMTNNTLQMVKGRRYQVKTKFGSTTVTKTGTYKSSKPAVATVSSTGLVTAKAPGTTTIKVTYNGKSQSFKIKVIASHTHSWKTLTKATCAAKGKKLCKTCGATGTTAMKTTHSFAVTKKATCETKGAETCTVCGLKNTLPKTSHNYVTETWEKVEGRGKAYFVNTFYCNGCGIDMSDWPVDKASAHWTDLAGMQAGTTSEECWSAGYNGASGVEKFPKYVMAKKTETYCKTCGAHEDLTVKDLYEVYYDEWRNVVRKSDNKILEETVWYKKAKPYLEKAKELNGTAKATAKAVAAPQDVINTADNNDVIDNGEIATEIVSENETVSDNAIVSDNDIDVSDEVNTDITDPIQGGDIVFDEDSDDDTDIEDDGSSDYDGSEGDVVEDE